MTATIENSENTRAYMRIIWRARALALRLEKYMAESPIYNAKATAPKEKQVRGNAHALPSKKFDVFGNINNAMDYVYTDEKHTYRNNTRGVVVDFLRMD